MKKKPEGPYWTPPEEYLEALRERVFPIYAELLEDPFVRRAPFGWSDRRMEERGIPPAWGPCELGSEPFVTDLFSLFYRLEFRLESLTLFRTARKELGFPAVDWQRPEDEEATRLFGILIRLRETLLEVLDEFRPHEAAQALPLRMILDGTVRTLYEWVICQEDEVVWRFPLHPWPDRENTRPKDDPNHSLRERMEIASQPPEGGKEDVRRDRRIRYVYKANDKELLKSPFIKGLPSFLTSEGILETVQNPDTLKNVLWAVVTLAEHSGINETILDRTVRKGRKRCLPSEKARKDREELQAIGERLLARYNHPKDRWTRGRILSDWLHELRDVEVYTWVAEEILKEEGLLIGWDGRDLDAKIPQPPGKAGSPKSFFKQLVVRVYEYYRGEKADRDPRRPRDGKLPPRRSPDLDALEQTASALEWILPQPEKWIVRTLGGKLSSKGKLYRTVNRECYGGS